MSDLKVTCRIVPELDPGFVPAALWNREFRRLAANGIDAAITLERSNGAVSRFDTKLLPDTEENLPLNFRYVERIVKFMLWAYGGRIVTVAGAPKVAVKLAEVYSADGARAFDYQVMGERIYGGKFEIRSVSYAEAAPEKKISVKLGGNFSGCRIGFDLGGSDRKCAAVIDGKPSTARKSFGTRISRRTSTITARAFSTPCAGRRRNCHASTPSAVPPPGCMWRISPGSPRFSAASRRPILRRKCGRSFWRSPRSFREFHSWSSTTAK